MKFIFDENTPPILPRILKLSFNDNDKYNFYSIKDHPFKPSMRDEDIFSIITSEEDWYIISYDKFRQHPVQIFKKNCRIIRLNQKDWLKMSCAEQCWRFIKIFANGNSRFETLPLGNIYKLSRSGDMKRL